MAQKIDQVRMLGPDGTVGDCDWRREIDQIVATCYAADPEIASDALGYDVAHGEYDTDEAAAAIMRLAGGW